MGRVGDRLSEINKQLVLFPDRPTLPTYTVITEINKLSATISNHVRGNEDVNLFRREVEDIILDLKKQLIDAKPTFDWKTPGWKAPSLSLISDDEEMPDATPTPLPQRRAPIVTPTTTRKRNAEATPSSQRRVKKEPSAPTVQKQKHTLEGLRAEYDCGRTSSVPSAINPKVTDRLSLQALSSWDVIVDRMLQSMTAKILSQIQDSIAQDLAGWHATRFFARTTEVLTAFVHRLMQDETNEVKRLLACEQYRPITYSKWTALNGARVRDFEAARRLQRTKEWFETHEADKAKATPNDKRAEKARDLAWAQANLGDDEYQKLLECAATIAAYYDTASMCFIDTVAKNLEFGVMRPLRDEVLSTLSEELRAGDVDECTMLLAEDPQREAERAKLMAEKERLEKALAELNGLGA